MKTSFFFISLLIICKLYCGNVEASESKNEAESDLGKLKFVHVIFRHGDRTPVKPYANDPYKNESLWPTGFGQLTNKGKLRHYELGEWLRNRYADFLPDQYSREDVYIRSTDVDRTLMSALSNLAGLYPPKTKQIWKTELSWQPIPVHTVPETEDNVLAAKKHCARYDNLLKLLLQSPKFQNINLVNKALYDYLSVNSGEKINSLESLEYLYNTLTIEETNNFTLPAWTKGVYPDKLKKWAGFSFTVPCFTKKLQRYKTGLLLNEIVERIKNRTSLEETMFPPKKLVIYSAHDVTISNVLMSLSMFDPHSPPYASTILLELRQNSENQYGIVIYYKNTTEARLMKLPNCDAFCPIENFTAFLKPILITKSEWESECQLSLLSQIKNSTNLGSIALLAILTGSLFVVLLVGSLLIALAYLRDRSPNNRFYMRLDGNEGVN